MTERTAPRPASGFTVTELLVVIAVIALVVSLVVSAAGPLRQNAWSTKDLTQLRTLAQAINSYAADQAGYLPSPRTKNESLGSAMAPVTNAWVNTSASGGVVASWDTEKSLAAGSLWPYMNAVASAYKSPFDTTRMARSYSMSGYVGSGGRNITQNPPRMCDDWWTQFGKNTMTIGRIPQPSNTMAFIGEDDPTANFNEFGWCHPALSTGTWLGKWIDLPPLWGGNSINISMVDGSAQSLKILSPRLRKWFETAGHESYEPAPYVAWRIMRQYTLPGAY
jgi:prepilin-type N-terminal cleavage/methylation domain-containing protein